MKRMNNKNNNFFFINKIFEYHTFFWNIYYNIFDYGIINGNKVIKKIIIFLKYNYF